MVLTNWGDEEENDERHVHKNKITFHISGFIKNSTRPSGFSTSMEQQIIDKNLKLYIKRQINLRQQLLYVCLLNEEKLTQCKGLFSEAETHMVWNVKIVIGQPDTVPAHLVDQVFPDDDDLLAAVLDPDRKNTAGHFTFLRTEIL